MNRSPRRIREVEPAVTPYGVALDWELSDTWPSMGDYHRFWNAARIPAHLRERSRPDPRRILGDELDKARFHRDVADWKSARIAWLRSRV